MIGKFIVYESVFRNRWVARKVTGQTEKTITVERCVPAASYHEDTANRKKMASLGRYALFDTAEEASEVALAMTTRLLELADAYQAQKKRAIDFALGAKE